MRAWWSRLIDRAVRWHWDLMAELTDVRRALDSTARAARVQRERAEQAESEVERLKREAADAQGNYELYQQKAEEEIERLRAALATERAERQGQERRAESNAHQFVQAEAQLAKAVKALREIIDTAPSVAQGRIHVVRIKRIAEHALTAAQPKHEVCGDSRGPDPLCGGCTFEGVAAQPEEENRG